MAADPSSTSRGLSVRRGQSIGVRQNALVARGLQDIGRLSEQQPDMSPAGAKSPCGFENKKDGSILLLVPGGKFLASAPGADQGEELSELDLPPFYLGITLVTNAQYTRFLESTGHRPLQSRRASGTPWHVWNGDSLLPENANRPVVSVSWDDARAYCAWADLELPSDLQWEKAVRGNDGRKFPWGSQWDDNEVVNRLIQWHIASDSEWRYQERCGPWGHYGMAGTVWEWCADVYDASLYEQVEWYCEGVAEQRANLQWCVFRGGSFRHAFIRKVLKTLNPKEQLIYRIRFGLTDGFIYTREEISHIFRIAPEEVRQIEAKAIRSFKQLAGHKEQVGFSCRRRRLARPDYLAPTVGFRVCKTL